MRAEFSAIVRDWQSDAFDTLIARIDMAGDWMRQNGGPESLQPDERDAVVSMMATALRAGLEGANPKRGTRQ